MGAQNAQQATGNLKSRVLQAYLRDAAGSDHCSKTNAAVKWHNFLDAPVHMKLVFLLCYSLLRASQVTLCVKDLPAMQETWVWFLGWEDPLEEGMALQYSCLENPMDRGDWWAIEHGVAKSRTWPSTWAHTCISLLSAITLCLRNNIFVSVTQYFISGTCLVMQWLKLSAHKAGGLSSILSQGSRPHMPLLRLCVVQLKTEDPLCHS